MQNMDLRAIKSYTIKRRFFFFLHHLFIADERSAWDASPTYRSHCEVKNASTLTGMRQMKNV
jgi:hypothetical protein